MPSAVAVVWTLTPLHIPSAVITAARRPRDMPWATTNVLSGPGAIVSRSDAPRKATIVERGTGNPPPGMITHARKGDDVMITPFRLGSLSRLKGQTVHRRRMRRVKFQFP